MNPVLFLILLVTAMIGAEDWEDKLMEAMRGLTDESISSLTRLEQNLMAMQRDLGQRRGDEFKYQDDQAHDEANDQDVEAFDQEDQANDQEDQAKDEEDEANDKANDEDDQANDKANDEGDQANDKANDEGDQANDKTNDEGDQANDKTSDEDDQANDEEDQANEDQDDEVIDEDNDEEAHTDDGDDEDADGSVDATLQLADEFGEDAEESGPKLRSAPANKCRLRRSCDGQDAEADDWLRSKLNYIKDEMSLEQMEVLNVADEDDHVGLVKEAAKRDVQVDNVAGSCRGGNGNIAYVATRPDRERKVAQAPANVGNLAPENTRKRATDRKLGLLLGMRRRSKREDVALSRLPATGVVSEICLLPKPEAVVTKTSREEKPEAAHKSPDAMKRYLGYEDLKKTSSLAEDMKVVPAGAPIEGVQCDGFQKGMPVEEFHKVSGKTLDQQAFKKSSEEKAPRVDECQNNASEVIDGFVKPIEVVEEAKSPVEAGDRSACNWIQEQIKGIKEGLKHDFDPKVKNMHVT